MPVSDSWGKDWAARRIALLNEAKEVRTVFDFGAGVGTYAFVLRPAIPSAHFTAIEAWEPYVEEYCLRDIYNHVIIDDMTHISPWFFPMPDLAVFGDVLEHVDKDIVREILRARIVCNVSKLTLICVPMLHLEQGSVNGNPYEIHRMENHWHHEEMISALRQACSYADSISPTPWAIDTLRGDVVAYYLVRQGIYASEVWDGAEAQDGSIQRP